MTFFILVNNYLQYLDAEILFTLRLYLQQIICCYYQVDVIIWDLVIQGYAAALTQILRDGNKH
jgi:hypothetical protein